MSFRLLQSLAKKLSRKRLNRELERFVSEIPAGSKILNIGSGGIVEHVIRKHIKDDTITLTSTDIDPDRKPDIVDDLTQTGIPAESFEYIVCSEVLEHVNNPQAAVASLHSILTPGGKLFLSTPYMFPTHDAPHDYFRYTEYGLRELFKAFTLEHLVAKTNWWETLLLILWRIMWIGDTKTKLGAWLVTLFLLPILPFVWLFARKKQNLAFTAGFVLCVRK